MEVVISGENRYDDYGNFFFKDKAGEEHKIGEKRENQEKLIDLVENNPDRAVKLTFDEYKGRSYIVGIELLEIPVDGEKITEQQAAPPVAPTKPAPPVAPTKPAPQELGMWWKELGKCIRSGLIDKDFPNSAVKIRGQYYKQMETVTGISMKKED